MLERCYFEMTNHKVRQTLARGIVCRDFVDFVHSLHYYYYLHKANPFSFYATDQGLTYCSFSGFT